MTNRTPLAIFFLASLAIVLPTATRAADPGFCRQYARAALSQVRDGLSNPACGRALQGTRWSSDFAVHYEWCLGVSTGAASDERNARAHHLKRCGAQ
jgi:hypothetical protein